MKNLKPTFFKLAGIIIILIVAAFILPAYALANGDSNSNNPLPGDLNGDGKVNILDFILLKLTLLGQETPTDSADVDGNGIINMLDLDDLLDQFFGQASSSHGGGGGGGGGGSGVAVTNQVNFELSIYPSSYGPGATGQTFNATVKIAQTSFLYNGSFTVDYNPSILQVHNVNNGLFATSCVINMLNGTDWIDAEGQLTVFPNLSSCATNGSGVSGNGYLCEILFETKGAGTSPLILGNGSLYQSQSGNISAIAGTTWINSSAQITQLYSLNITSSDHGNVTDPGEGTFNRSMGQQVSITATTTDDCWQFYRWEGDTITIADVNASSTTITMNGDYSISANFSIKQFSLGLTANNSAGSPSIEGSSPFTCNTTVNISANTDSCYTFAGWTPTEGISDWTAENTSVLMNKSRALTARYSIKQYTLTIDTGVGGGSANLSVGDYPYNCSTVVSVLAIPNDCRIFKYWTSSNLSINSSTDNPISITMDGDKDLAPVFEVSTTFTLSLDASPTAGGSPTANGSSFDCGTYASIQANTDPCYDFVNWTPSAGVTSPTSADTIVLMNTSRNITANYAIKRFTLSVTASPTAGGSPTGTGTYDCNSNASVSANNSSCYNFVSWSSTGDITVVEPSAATTNVTMNGNGTVTANYAIKQFTLTTDVSPTVANTSGCTVTGGGTYNCSTNVAIQAYNAGQYSFAYWTSTDPAINDSTNNPENVVINSSKTVTANFVINPNTVYLDNPSTVPLGNQLNVKINMTSIVNFRDSYFSIRYNQSVLSYKAGSAIIGQIGGQASEQVGVIVVQPGLIKFVPGAAFGNYAQFVNNGYGINGSGYFCQITFNTSARGTSPLTFTSEMGGELTLIGIANYVLFDISPAYWISGSVTVQ